MIYHSNQKEDTVMAQQRRGGGARRRKKVCYFTANHIKYIDYKDV